MSKVVLPMLAAVLAALPLTAGAQAPAPAQPQGLGGPVVPGVCLLSREAVLANSKVGVYATQRVRQLASEAQAEIDAERKPLESEAAALRADTRLPADQRAARQKALAEKLGSLQAKAELRTREIEKTRSKAIETISAQAQPVIQAVYTQKGCGLLLDRNSALGGNFANDLTAAVVAGLDARLTQIAIQRETIAPGK